MSLINRQQLMWAQDDRADALRRISVGEDTQKVRDLLAGSTKRIAKIEKEIAQQEAKAEADRQASQAKAEATAERNAKGKKSAGGAGRDCLRVKHAKNEAASVKSGSKTSVKAGSKA
jgi:hypothetical protein